MNTAIPRRPMGSVVPRIKRSKFINKSGKALLEMIEASPNQDLLRPRELECIAYCKKMMKDFGGEIMPNEESELRGIAMAICYK